MRIGTHKQTGEKHAVKIVKRAQLPVEDEESILMEVSLLLLQLCFTFLCLVNWPLPCQGFGYTTTTTYCILNDSEYFQVQILKRLKGQSNIVQITDFFEEKDYYYLVFEFMKGGELFDRIVEKQFYNEKEVSGINVACLFL